MILGTGFLPHLVAILTAIIMPCGPPANPSAWHYLISAAIMVLVNVLSWISLISPSRVGFSHYSMVAVSPQPNVAGPSVWLGPFSSCGRANASFETHCTYIGQLDLRFKYSLSVLPERVHFALRAPPMLLRVSLVLTAALLTVFLVLLIIMTGVLWFHAPHQRFSNYRQALAWIAFVLSFIGSVNISILEFHFQTSRRVFNLISGGTGLVASRGDTINLAYAAYTLVFVPFCLITKDVANIDDAHHINAMVAHLLLLNAQTTGPQFLETRQKTRPRTASPDGQHHVSLHSGDDTERDGTVRHRRVVSGIPLYLPLNPNGIPDYSSTAESDAQLDADPKRIQYLLPTDPQNLPPPTHLHPQSCGHIPHQLSSTTRVVTRDPDLPIGDGTLSDFSTTTSASIGRSRGQRVDSATEALPDDQSVSFSGLGDHDLPETPRSSQFNFSYNHSAYSESSGMQLTQFSILDASEVEEDVSSLDPFQGASHNFPPTL